MGVSRFEIGIGPNNMFQWKLFGPDGNVTLASRGFGNKDDAFAEIRAVKEAAPFGERYERRADDGGKLIFRLKSASHQVLATGGPFAKEEERDKAVAAVRSSVEAAVMDKTVG